MNTEPIQAAFTSLNHFDDPQREALVLAMDCLITCEHGTDVWLHAGGMDACVRNAQDAADACMQLVRTVARGSELHPQAATLCANACEACAYECDQHDEEHCRLCAQSCRETAEICRKVAEPAG